MCEAVCVSITAAVVRWLWACGTLCANDMHAEGGGSSQALGEPPVLTSMGMQPPTEDRGQSTPWIMHDTVIIA